MKLSSEGPDPSALACDGGVDEWMDWNATLVWKDVSPKGNGLLGVLLMFTLPVNTGKQNQAEQKSVDKAPLTGEG